jgi:thioredoxin reductase (NADPH)
MTELVVAGLGIAIALYLIARTLESWSRSRRLAGTLAHAPGTPPSVYPRINKDACICSGACIDACPEGNVIEIVGGRPRVVRTSACVGHGDCLRSCPVNAIELVMGSSDRAVAVPITTSSFETTVPGLFVAGEVTGVGLIHNAVAQGRQAAMAALTDLDVHEQGYDLIVVGAGPAGIGAALEARRRGARCLVVEKGEFGGAIRSYPRQKVVLTAPLQLPGIGAVKLRRTSKEALLELFEDIVQRARLSILDGAEVTAIRRLRGGFLVETTRKLVTARRIVMAIGRRGSPRRLGVPGSELPHVVYEVLDPANHARESIVVVGGGDSAVELAVMLAAAGARVTLVHRGADFGRCKPDNQIALGQSRVDVRLGAAITRITADEVEVTGDVARIAATRVVCCLGSELPTEWLRTLGIGVRELRGEPLH